MKKANSLAFTPIITVTVLAVYLGINFFGFGPLSQVFFKLFSKVHIERKPRKNKKNNNTPTHKSSEPEEAIFIGIND